MSPEQLQGKNTDARADIFAFGVIVYEMLTGRKEFEGTSQASLIAAMLQTDPNDRVDLNSLSTPLGDELQQALRRTPIMAVIVDLDAPSVSLGARREAPAAGYLRSAGVVRLRVRRVVSSDRHLGKRHRYDFKTFNTHEVIRVAGVQGKAVSHGRRCNHRVVGAGVDLSAGAPQRRGHSAEGPCGGGVERQRIEIGLGLLEVRLTRGTLRISRCHQGPDGKLRECHGRDERLLR